MSNQPGPENWQDPHGRSYGAPPPPPPPPGGLRGPSAIPYPGAPRPGAPWTPPGGARTNVLAVVSFFSMFLFMPLAVVLALIARVQIRRSHGAQKGMGWTTAVLVIASLAVAALLLTLWAVQP